jgi:hypothetical protein
MPKKSAAMRPGSERREREGKTGTTSMLGSRKSAGTGGAWSTRKLRRKAGDERTARWKAQQEKAARTRLGRSGRRRKISRRRSSPRSVIVVGPGGGAGGCSMADDCGELEQRPRIWERPARKNPPLRPIKGWEQSAQAHHRHKKA